MDSIIGNRYFEGKMGVFLNPMPPDGDAERDNGMGFDTKRLPDILFGFIFPNFSDRILTI